MNFSSKKRVRKNAWKELETELAEREQLEEENTAKQRKLDALRARVCIEEEPNPTAKHCFMDFEVGRKMGRDPQITRGRLIVELFDDIMPRTTERFMQLLTSETEPRYRDTLISKIMPGDFCVAGDRDTRMEGVYHSRENIFGRIESEANWYGATRCICAEHSRVDVLGRRSHPGLLYPVRIRYSSQERLLNPHELVTP